MPSSADRTVEPSAGPRAPFSTTLALALIAGVAALGAFATLFSVWYRTTVPGDTETLRIAMDEYVAGRYDIAQRLALRVQPDLEQSAENYQVREFLLGASEIHLAWSEPDTAATRKQIAAAVPHLEWLAQNQFPAGRLAEGQQLLGLGHQELGNFRKAIIPLQAAIAENPTLERELLLPLAECSFRATGVNMQTALGYVETYLRLPNLRRESVNQALLLRAKVESAMRDWKVARRTLGLIDDESMRDEADLALAQIYIDEAKVLVSEHRTLFPDASGLPLPVTELLAEANEVLAALVRRGESRSSAIAKYLAATVYRISGEPERALSLFAALRQNVKQTAVAIAAGIQEAELLAETRQYTDALMAARAVVREIGDPVGFDARWLSLAEVRTRLEAIGEIIRQGGGFDESIEYAEALPPVVDPADALRMKAESLRRWGDYLKQLGQSGDPKSMPENRLQSRQRYRQSGATFAEVAKLRFTQPEYVELVWEAIDAYQRGRAYRESLDLLDEYLRYEQRGRKPRALIAKGRALAAIGRPAESLKPLTDCIAEYPRDSLTYEARLHAAVAWAELGDVQQARQLLEDNVFDQWLSPESPVYRDSLFVLGDLLYRSAAGEYLRLTSPTLVAGRLSPGDRPRPEIAAAMQANQETLDTAIARLEQAEVRDRKFESIERSRRAAYLAAEAHRLAAFWPGIQAADAETLQSARNQLNQTRMAHLKKANEGFQKLKTELVGETGERKELLPWEEAMLKNCFMGVADTWFEMDEFQLAAAAYQKVSQEFMNEPLALEALLQQSRSLQRLGNIADSKLIYKQAAKILERIPSEEDLRFAQTTRYDRKDWSELLNWLQET
jgi:hypothetical protein